MWLDGIWAVLQHKHIKWPIWRLDEGKKTLGKTGRILSESAVSVAVNCYDWERAKWRRRRQENHFKPGSTKNKIKAGQKVNATHPPGRGGGDTTLHLHFPTPNACLPYFAEGLLSRPCFGAMCDLDLSQLIWRPYNNGFPHRHQWWTGAVGVFTAYLTRLFLDRTRVMGVLSRHGWI